MASSRLLCQALTLLHGVVLGAGLAWAGERTAARPAPASIEPAALVTDARLGGDGSRTRFIADLSKPIEMTAFTLADPYRVIIDLPQVGFQLPANTGTSGRGLVKAFRFGLIMAGASRIVIDAAGPVRIDKAFVLDPIDGQPARLVLDLVAVDRDTFMRNLALEAKPRRAEPARKNDRDSHAITSDQRPVVVIDPGHGGLDGGTSAATGEAEKNIVLDFARELRDRLEKAGKYRVVMTRSDDSFVTLSERVRIARANKAALFISIHADAITRRDPDTRGATVYTGSETASDAEAASLAESENKADVVAGVDLSSEPDELVADILIDLVHRETRSFSAQFARTLVSELKTAARLHKNPVRSAGFKVLTAPDVPSVLLELGYITSPHDLKLMTSTSWRQRAAESMAQAVGHFFATRLADRAAAIERN